MSNAQPVSAQIRFAGELDLTCSLPYQPRFFWDHDLWGHVPRWLSAPDTAKIETLSRDHLLVPGDCPISVTFFAEGAFNKLYTIAVSDGGDSIGSPQYIFRVTSPVEPFYKTASEVATLSYPRKHTSIPVPRAIASNSRAENELGWEWILLEMLPGVALADVWSDMDMETKGRMTKVIAGFLRQLRDIQQHFPFIGNLYFHDDISPLVRHYAAVDTKYTLGPIVTPFMFAGGRKLRIPRDLGPYPNDAEYVSALATVELEDMKLLQ